MELLMKFLLSGEICFCRRCALVCGIILQLVVHRHFGIFIVNVQCTVYLLADYMWAFMSYRWANFIMGQSSQRGSPSICSKVPEPANVCWRPNLSTTRLPSCVTYLRRLILIYQLWSDGKLSWPWCTRHCGDLNLQPLDHKSCTLPHGGLVH